MRVDAEVSRRKFDLELRTLAKQREILHSWGCWIHSQEFPYVDAVFVPRRNMRLSLPMAPSQVVLLPNEPAPFVTVDLPSLAGRAFGVRVGLDDYDQRAPSVTFHDPWTRQPLAFETMFRGSHVDDTGRVFAVLLPDHPVTHRPFLCMRGTREYHEHPQHTGDDWMLYRGQFGLFSVLATIWRTCVELSQPNLVVTPPNLQVRWEAIQERPK